VPGVDAVRAAAAADRPKLIEALLRDKVARVLGTDPGRLDADRPLLQLGLDSLMAVELRNWIEGGLRVNLPIAELMRSPSLAGLAALLARNLAPEGGAAHDAPAGGPAASPLETPAEHLLANVENLPSEQVDALLTALLEAQGHGVDR
jgi:aryl carrier-like protein